MREALYYEKQSDQNLVCNLCPRNCHIKPGSRGSCKVRTNRAGILYTEIFNKVASIAIDPIEKKPLYHFYPGSDILSLGATGCNFNCSFCQNYQISQCSADDFQSFTTISSDKIIELAIKTPNNCGIAYTYNEPFTFYEFLFEIAEKAHLSGLKNVVVTNGYINETPLLNILPLIDAFNVDLKAFSPAFYRKQANAELKPVLETLRTIAQSTCHLEITCLIIPGLNDSLSEFREMVEWISNELGKQTPFHISRYFPSYKTIVESTPLQTIFNFYETARMKLDYVYTGNTGDVKTSTTYCPGCGEAVISRDRFLVQLHGLKAGGTCGKCGTELNISL